MDFGGSLGGIIGGLVGREASSGDAQNQENNYKNALAQFAGINIPTIEEQTVNPMLQTSAGTLAPEQQTVISQGNSLLNNVSTDPRLQDAQMQALSSLQQYVNGGMTNADKAGYALARNDAAGEMQAKQNQILQQMQQRGQGGSGAELLARLTGAQAGTSQLQNALLQQAQAQQQAKLAALSQSANLASGIRAQQYGEKSATANAQDAINRFNTQNAQSVQGQNVGANNAAQQYNLSNAQNISNSNTGAQNTAQYHNKSLLQTQFGNQMGLAGAKAGQYGNLAKYYGDQAQNTQDMYSGIGQGVGTAVAAGMTGGASLAGDVPAKK